ncbi:NAD-dependent epimerase/dehydratase family protein [Ruminococcus sp.]|uniref:NAD-dependent epimerase/dehydratase family protein n=1 Tax=Ruminococcus sp. TaxID=41978 RepID=UPI0025F438F1|nr:NAD-dependent epimerase/dehydratase family protein [Ruminococcus sp.]
MKILILGGTGIISSEITSLAVLQGFDVSIVNRGRRKEFINPKAKCIICDLKQDSIESICSKLDEHYDAVIDVVSYTDDVLKRNLEIAKDRCNQYIFFSTCVVYKTKTGRYTENDEIGNTSWLYSINKIKCEKLLIDEAESMNFKWTIVRPYITYGKTRIPLQFAPLEYYTIIERAKNKKVVPVLNRDVKCTLTSSKDFAVGLVGLVNNSRAFNQSFNIVGNYETTWNEVLSNTMNAFDISLDIIGLDDSIFKNQKLMNGINFSEVVGDKGRDMLFDNNKIRSVVPSFSGETGYLDILSEIVGYFSDESHQKVNYAWDARVDCMLSKTKLLTKEQKKHLVFHRNSHSTLSDRLIYFFHRYDSTYFIYQVYSKIKHVFK